jgi:hypothetical protein
LNKIVVRYCWRSYTRHLDPLSSITNSVSVASQRSKRDLMITCRILKMEQRSAQAGGTLASEASCRDRSCVGEAMATTIVDVCAESVRNNKD